MDTIYAFKNMTNNKKGMEDKEDCQNFESYKFFFFIFYFSPHSEYIPGLKHWKQPKDKQRTKADVTKKDVKVKTTSMHIRNARHAGQYVINISQYRV